VLNNIEKKEIIKTWLAGQQSCTLVIPKEFAKIYGLDQPSHVVVEGRPDGILIKKLQLQGDNNKDEPIEKI
jgi:bifunctional DNA-binding transcriptional regulator/antitoxin component of YhaV-PrlF toxin-antitoxin module